MKVLGTLRVEDQEEWASATEALSAGEGCFRAILGQWGRRSIDTKSMDLTQPLGQVSGTLRGRFRHTGCHLHPLSPVQQVGSSLVRPLSAALDHSTGLDPVVRVQEHLPTGCDLVLFFSSQVVRFLLHTDTVPCGASLLCKFLESTWMSRNWATLFLSQRMMTSAVWRRGNIQGK